jgi:hypothetical protein
MYSICFRPGVVGGVQAGSGTGITAGCDESINKYFILTILIFGE